MSKTKKKRSFFFDAICHTFFTLPRLFHATSHALHLVKMEAGQIKKNIVWLILLVSFMMALATATWISLLVIVFYSLQSFNISIFLSLFFVLLLNLLCIVILAFMLSHILKNLFFPQSRQLLASIKRRDGF